MLILITTSDYLPKLGGLSTFTRNIEEVITDLGIPYRVFHWNDPQEILHFDPREIENYELIINVHVLFCWLAPSGQERMMNFIHGSEILMTSPNIFKRIIKNIKKETYFSQMYRSYFNFFISKATQDKAKEKGFKIDYSRDVIFHNCININAVNRKQLPKKLCEELVFTCIVRNVPHKNVSGAVKFCELVQTIYQIPVKLILPKNTNAHSTKITIEELLDQSDLERNNSYKVAHYNLLLSLDHSKFGYFEGFGLTVLEAGQFAVPSIVFNTGGLPESVHHNETGYVIDSISEDVVNSLPNLINETIYYTLSEKCFFHTIENHSLDEYKKFFGKILSVRSSA
jgi:glycosyltransferase involved in cell wall biosynthesis